MKTKLTDAGVAKLPLPSLPKDREIYWDAAQPGFGLMVTRNGHKSFVFQYRWGSKSRRISFKRGLTLAEARKEARKLQGTLAHGKDPFADRISDSLKAVAENYFRLEGHKLRSAGELHAMLGNLPFLLDTPIGKIKRSDVTRMVDEIAATRGTGAAHRSLGLVRAIMNWHARRSDDYVSPIVRGMSPRKPSDATRGRELKDDDLQALWAASEASTSLVGPFCQFLLLTGCRRTEASHMTWDEIVGDVWTLPAERAKNGQAHAIPLSPMAKAVLNRLPHIQGSKYVFTTPDQRPFTGYSDAKRQIDAASNVTGWVFHDLRKAARSLLAKAGVKLEVAERCLNHSKRGMVKIYDRYEYEPEMKLAFEKLAALIDRIVNPVENVVALRGSSAG